jgi:hypothetical protein
MNARFNGRTVAALLALALLAACPTSDEGDGGGKETVGTPGAIVSPICGANGSEVLILVDTSARMGLSSGYLQGSKTLSRSDLVVDVLKKSLPHLKKAVDFGLMTFPYEGKKDKNGDPRVCPTSCGAGPVQVEPGSPYGWIVSSLEHIEVGGFAGVGNALEAARAWYSGHPAAGRVRSVMLFTGGGAECGGEAVAQAAALLSDGIPTYVFSFANSPDLDGPVAAIAAAGGRPSAHATGAYLVYPGMDILIGQGPDSSTPETCNGIDDDCDGVVDEGLVQACSTACGTGEQVCGAGAWSACVVDTPNAELCNGVDDDCDGDVDEDFDDGLPCMATNGGCKAVGVKVCKADGSGTYCDAHVQDPGPEVCDGLDNDCDGSTDEGLAEACATPCGAGHRACSHGLWGACVVDVPNVEVCDGLDNDCDGAVDEDLVGDACETACGTGHRACVAGIMGACVIDVPNVELCNGVDDDCDGLVDEGFNVGQACGVKEGSCSGHGELACSADGLESFCNAVLGAGGAEECDGVDNDCDGLVDEGASCPDGQVCFKGACVYD